MADLRVDDEADEGLHTLRDEPGVVRIVRPRRKRRTGRRLLLALLGLVAVLGAIVAAVFIVQTLRGDDLGRVEVRLQPDGSVSLDGVVPANSDSNRAFDILAGRYGAERVDNNLRVNSDLVGEPGIVVLRGRVATTTDDRQLDVIGDEIASPNGWRVENNAIVVPVAPATTELATPASSTSAVGPTTTLAGNAVVPSSNAVNESMPDAEASTTTEAPTTTTAAPSTTTTAPPSTTTTVDVAMLEAELNAGIGSADVIFGYNSADLTGAARTQLNSIADILRANPGPRIEVGGHTDATGPAGRNQTLSQERAEAVVRHLIGEGIDRGRLVGKGYGETENIATNRTDEGRAQNRRIEFKILN